MRMKYNGIVKEIPTHLIPTYKMLGWVEVESKSIAKPIEKVEKTNERLAKKPTEKLVEKNINEEE